MTDGVTYWLRYFIVVSMATSNRNVDHARAFPRSDAHHFCLSNVKNVDGLSAQECCVADTPSSS